MKDLTSGKLMYLKAILFVCSGFASWGLVITEHPTFKVALLSALSIWCFARAYYFAFYVIQNYIDRDYRYSGLWSLLTYLLKRQREK